MKKITLTQSVLAKGKSLCKALNDVLVRLEEMEFEDVQMADSQQEVIDELFELIVKVAILFCGDTSWTNLKAFLAASGVEFPSDFESSMSFYEHLSDTDLNSPKN